jgi:rfaE bifunctional protein kinase chain/domain
MDFNEINQIFERFKQMHVIVIGDAMVDTYLWGKVERVSPEAPVPIVSVIKHENRLGGAGNVSLNIKALGATPYLFSVIGKDDKGRKFKRMLQKEKLSGEGIFEDPDRLTTVKSRIISKGQHIARVDEESSEYIGKDMENAMIKGVEKLLKSREIDVVVFVDYDKGVVTPSFYDKVSKMAIKKGIPIAVDPKKRNFNHFKNVTLFKPNFKEFIDGIGLPVEKGDFATIKKIARTLKQKQNFKLIFITLSELGVLISNGVEEQHYPAIIRDIADVSGAGDTVIAVASLAMAAKLSQKTMAFIANLAGGLVCEKVGVVPVNKEQLMKEMNLQNV